MNNDDIKYFEQVGSEFLQECTGDWRSEFLFWNAGRYQYFQDEGDGNAYILEFMAFTPEGSELDTEYFAEELVKKHSPLYSHGCSCSHDCCGHYFTINMGIYHKKLEYQDDGRDVHKWAVLIHNAVNL